MASLASYPLGSDQRLTSSILQRPDLGSGVRVEAVNSIQELWCETAELLLTVCWRPSLLNVSSTGEASAHLHSSMGETKSGGAALSTAFHGKDCENVEGSHCINTVSSRAPWVTFGTYLKLSMRDRLVNILCVFNFWQKRNFGHHSIKTSKGYFWLKYFQKWKTRTRKQTSWHLTWEHLKYSRVSSAYKNKGPPNEKEPSIKIRHTLLLSPICTRQ